MAVKLTSAKCRSVPAYLTLLMPLVLLLGISCGKEKDLASEKEAAADQEYLNNAGAEWDRLFNSGDVLGLAGLYAEDAFSMPFNAPTIYGRIALRTDFENFLSKNAGEHKTRVDEILKENNWAIELAHYTLTYTSKTTGDVTVETGRHVVCRKKINGQWQIAWEIWNTDRPPTQ